MSRREHAMLDSSAELPALGHLVDFMRLIWALDHSLQRASKRMNTVFGVTGQQRLVIRIVGRFPGILSGGVAAILYLHPSTVSAIVKRLEKRGLLTLQVDPRDRRRAPLGLTEQGLEIDRLSAGTIEAAVASALAKLPSDTLRCAGQTLSMLTRELEKAGRRES